jgi:hypothetical protein
MSFTVRRTFGILLASLLGIVGMSLISAQPANAGTVTGYGYQLTRAETNQIANLSMWNAVSGVSSSKYIPFSKQLMQLHAIDWVLTARAARSMGKCLGINWVGNGYWVGCAP